MSKQDTLYDLVVAGGGPGGVSAAIAAARDGARVLLLERYGFLGGMAAAALVNPFMPYAIATGSWRYDWEKKVNGGIFREVLDNLDALGGLHEDGQTFNEELLKLVLDRMTAKYGVDVVFHSYLTGVKREGRAIRSVTVTEKSGTREYFGKYFTDATGDADLCAMALCEYRFGREADSLCQPMTLCFRLANVDLGRYDRQETNRLYQQMQAEGRIKNPREDVLTFGHMADGVLHFNCTRIIGKNPLCAKELSEAEAQAREQAYELYQFMKNNIPGFENSVLLMSGAQIGIRESRRIVGEYTVTESDLLSAVKFPDSVARGTYPVDIHNPGGTGTVLRDIPFGDYYTIPYRALIPKGTDNLIAAGRPISSTHEAHAALRIMPICYCVGEGAGAAAAIAVKKSLPFRAVSPGALHERLDHHKALY